MNFRQLLSISTLVLGLTAQPLWAGNAVHQGSLSGNQYVSDSAGFSLTMPDGAEMFDGTHPLGGYLIISDLPEPAYLWGLSYNRIAQPEGGMDEAALKSAVAAAQSFWASSYEEETLEPIRESWIDIGGKPAHFSIVQGPDSELIYTSLSFHRGNFAYVLFERWDDDEDTSPGLDDKHRASITKFLETITFQETDEVKFRMGTE
ncbi:MAG: hypothetical protein RLN89_02480 [Parvibaculum sp.]